MIKFIQGDNQCYSIIGIKAGRTAVRNNSGRPKGSAVSLGNLEIDDAWKASFAFGDRHVASRYLGWGSGLGRCSLAYSRQRLTNDMTRGGRCPRPEYS